MDRRPTQPVVQDRIVTDPSEEVEALQAANERVCFLEWRLEQVQSALDLERAESRRLRAGLADAAGREADGAARTSDLERRLSDARREASALGDRLARLESERTAFQSRVLGAGDRASRQVAELQRGLLLEKQRAHVKGRALEHARERLVILEHARERFLARLLEWQRLMHDRDEDEIDLAEFIAEMRSEIVNLSTEFEEATAREGALREALAQVGVDPERVLGGGAIALVAEAPVLEAAPAEPDPAWSAVEAAPMETGLGRPASEAAPTEPDPAWSGPEAAPPRTRAVRDALEQVPDPARRRRALALLPSLFGEDPRARLDAARKVLELAGGKAGAALTEALNGAPDAAERVVLLGLVGRSGASSARDAVARHLGSSHTEEQIAALEAVLRLDRNDKDALRAHLTQAAAAAPAVRRRAVLACAALPRTDVATLLLPFVRDPDPQTRRVACAALAGATEPEAGRALLSALLDPEPSVRSAAAASLGVTDPDQVAALARGTEPERRRAVARLRTRHEPAA